MAQIQKISKNELCFRDHLTELRRRLLYCAVFLAVGMGLGWAYHEKLTRLLQKPLGQQLYFSDPTGGLGFIMQISLFAGLLFAIPVIIYQLLQFIRPISQKLSSWVVLKYVFISLILAACGVAFAYFCSLPAALKFLLDINSQGVTPLISADKYLTFVMTYLASFALIFQLPLILLFINRITPFSGGTLMRFERPVIVISFIAAAILTPTPDPINQLIMALPMILLYQVAVVCVLISNRVRRLNVVQNQPTPAKDMIITPAQSSLSYMPAKIDPVPITNQITHSNTIKSTIITQKLTKSPATFDTAALVRANGKTINLSTVNIETTPELDPKHKPINQAIDLRKLGFTN